MSRKGVRLVCPVCGGRKDFYAVACRSCSTPGKPLAGVTGPDHPAWKGGQRLDSDGYTRMYLPLHPWPRKGGYVLAHVAAMELSIGRRLAKGEVVHHIDHDKTNNALSNLELTTASAHSAAHRAKDKHTYRRDASGSYAPGKAVSP